LFDADMKRDGHVLCVSLTPAWQETLEFDRMSVGEVNRCRRNTFSAAGKGANVARVLTTLDVRTVLLSFCGGEIGRLWLDDLKNAGVRTEVIQTKAATRVCQTLLDRSTGEITELVREAPLPTPTEWKKLFRRFEERLDQARLVIFAGALMPGAKKTVYRDLARLARQQDVPVLIDSQKMPLQITLSQRPLLVKLNVHELGNTLNRTLRSDKQIIAAARALMKHGAQQVVVTHGAKGAWLVQPDRVWRFTPPRIQALNPIGSGDAAMAGIVYGILKGWVMAEAIRFAMACGAANALTLTPGEIDVEVVRKLSRQVTGST